MNGDNQMTSNSTHSEGMNRAKNWQLFLFSFNNGATNVYFILTATYIAYYANGVLGLLLLFTTAMVTIMRVFDGITDPIIGMLIDKTKGRFGKFRPYMVFGNAVMAVSAVLMYFGTRLIPESAMSWRYISFTFIYMVYVIGYTFQTACTKSGQTCITNDPKQRPLFTIFNTVASMAGMGLIQIVAVVIGGKFGFGSAEFFDFVVPLAIVLSIILTVLAVVGIWKKDQAENWGITTNQKPVKVREYTKIIKKNRELRMLIVAGGGTKLALSIATNTAVACMLYASMMSNYKGLYLTFYAMGYVAAVPFFVLAVRRAQKKGQKAALVRFTSLALILYVGVLVLLLIWQEGNPATMLSLTSLNLYTTLFVILYCIGYGSYYATADMVIPMVADCSDYETYRSGKYIPGVIGTLFSLVDKLISSLSSTIVGLAVLAIGMKTLPDTTTSYVAGMKWLVIILFCVIPMLSWIATLWAMKHYSLDGKRMKEIQAVNAVRKDAISNGMDLDEAINKWTTIEQVPEEFI